MEIPKQYEAQTVQERWYPVWEERGYFDAEPDPQKEPHTIMIPLPNVTGALHMGHALNGTCQDLITRWRRMQGYAALWMPGTDHAGIATQAVVERRMLEEEGKTRHDVGREPLVNRIWKWKDAYERRIIGQLKQLGASCDWRRTRFTLDEVCCRAVRRMFFKLFRDGLIYRGKRLVNWDTFLETAVADDEVVDVEIDGKFWTFTYPLLNDDGDDSGETIAFSTTRPETMLGDTAVCVHPKDDRYANLIGRKVRIPLNGEAIPIIADGQLADPELGTGAVKVTPAHDPNDYECGLRNDLEMRNILNSNGTLTDERWVPERFRGKDRYEVRTMVVEEMADAGHFLSEEERKIPLKHSDRSKTPIEPYLSDQWFVKMGPHKTPDGEDIDLAGSAMQAVEDKRVRFFPSRYSRTYTDWLSEKRDWCISRQLWWGHRIPIWSKTVSVGDSRDSFLHLEADLKECLKLAPGSKLQASLNMPNPADSELRLSGPITQVMAATWAGEGTSLTLMICPADGQDELEQKLEELGFEQDPDVLDTWFSSALWPHETLGWPDLDRNPPLDSPSEIPASQSNEVLDFFYPGNVLITARDIITLWVARMVLSGLYNMDDVPFRHVYIHPNIQDGYGQKMSKSKGNGVDPVELVEKYGTDAVRFTIASFAGETQDVRLPVGYECPHCEHYVPQTLEHQNARPEGGPKPTITCSECKQPFQFPSAWFDPDADAAVARVVSERFDFGRNFCNKLWNAARFALLNLEGYTAGAVSEDELQMEDRWVLSRLARTTAQVTTLLERYQFDQATRHLRDFTWNEFCDWYLEMIKPRLRDDAMRPAAQRVLVGVLDHLLRLLSPWTPFLAEEFWQRLADLAPERGLLSPEKAAESVVIAPWPTIAESWIDDGLERRFSRLQEIIAAVRNVRAVYNIPPQTPIRLFLKPKEASIAGEMEAVSPQFENLAKAVLEHAGVDVERPSGSANFTLPDADGYIPLEGIIDVDAEIERQSKEADKLRGHITGHEKKLANENFVAKAPEKVVNDVRETLAKLQQQLVSIEETIAQLRA